MNSQTQQVAELFGQMMVLKFFSYLTSALMLQVKVSEAVIKEGIHRETIWGEETYGKKTWAEGSWGKIENNKITLFHGTDRFMLDDILKEGLRPSYFGHGYEREEIKMIPKRVRPRPAVWLAYTPYLAFFFGNCVIQVTIPLNWIGEANDGVLVERYIPPSMIEGYILEENWK